MVKYLVVEAIDRFATNFSESCDSVFRNRSRQNALPHECRVQTMVQRIRSRKRGWPTRLRERPAASIQLVSTRFLSLNACRAAFRESYGPVPSVAIVVSPGTSSTARRAPIPASPPLPDRARQQAIEETGRKAIASADPIEDIQFGCGSHVVSDRRSTPPRSNCAGLSNGLREAWSRRS